jgi:hypothetical protein
MEGPMKMNQLPKTDSIQELAAFWDTHDLTVFENELEEVPATVFEREDEIILHLDADEARAVGDLARSRGVERSQLIRQWVVEKINAR